MLTRYDRDSDILYIRFADASVLESEEVSPGIVLDFDGSGKVVAIELLDASEQVTGGVDLARLAAA